MSILRTLVFFALWLPFTALLGIVAAPALVHTKLVWWVADFWSGVTLLWLRLSCNITSEVRGAESLPREKAIFASKHQSAWDTLMLWRTLNRPLFILKRELYWIPFFGWYLWRSNQIAINRADRKKAMEQILSQVQNAKNSGRPIVIFPEGTRGKVGADTTYHSGVAKLSAALGWPVIPVALNAGKFWPKRPVWKTSGHAVMQFLPALAACGEDKHAWMKQLKEQIELASRAL
ncbi:MAG: 1-acyl-sn-glycerol-3-phosphate acyltransferase [Alphaproteobacteria bacterium]|nr:1-acyl-sn-glycerol-3-phosphate acyltransferase [Alphaproteobacteria bacterium]